MDEAESQVVMANSITAVEFREALDKYPDVLKSLTKPPKEGSLSLEDLDRYRYETAPMNFSKNTGRNMELDDLKKLVDWKLRHGVYRPSIPKHIASNSEEQTAEALRDAFTYYAGHPDEIANTIQRLAKPLKGVGPATASLILSIHDPQEIVFFSDELFRWLVNDGKKVTPKYNVKEFSDLFDKAKTFMARIKCTPIELEKAAFVLIKESEPVRETIPKVLSGRSRGRPALPEGEKKVYQLKGTPRGRPKSDTTTDATLKRTGRPSRSPTPTGDAPKRGRPAKVTGTPPATTEPKKRGRPAKVATTPPVDNEPKKRGRPAKVVATSPATDEPKKRGRPAKSSSPVDIEPKKRGRPSFASLAAATSSSGKKRKAEDAPSKSAKKAKA